MTGEPGKEEKAQFNVYLPKALIRRAKYASIDAGQSLSRLVGDAPTAHLGRLETEGQVERGRSCRSATWRTWRPRPGSTRRSAWWRGTGPARATGRSWARPAACWRCTPPG